MALFGGTSGQFFHGPTKTQKLLKCAYFHWWSNSQTLLVSTRRGEIGTCPGAKGPTPNPDQHLHTTDVHEQTRLTSYIKCNLYHAAATMDVWAREVMTQHSTKLVGAKHIDATS